MVGTFCVPKKYRKKGTPAELAWRPARLPPWKGNCRNSHPAGVQTCCNSFPFHGSLLTQFCNGDEQHGYDLDSIFNLQKL